MGGSESRHAGAVAAGRSGRRITLAQVLGATIGLALAIFGGLGWTENGSFDQVNFGFEFDDDDVHGDLFLGIEVNGPLNILISAIGAVLLLGALRPRWARAAWGLVGAFLLFFAVMGWIDTNDVLETFTTNVPTNIAASVLGVLGLLLSREAIGDRVVIGGDHRHDRPVPRPAAAPPPDEVVVAEERPAEGDRIVHPSPAARTPQDPPDRS